MARVDSGCDLGRLNQVKIIFVPVSVFLGQILDNALCYLYNSLCLIGSFSSVELWLRLRVFLLLLLFRLVSSITILQVYVYICTYLTLYHEKYRTACT